LRVCRFENAQVSLHSMKWIMAAPSLARARIDLVVNPISDEAVNKAIALRQQPKMSPADSILAASNTRRMKGATSFVVLNSGINITGVRESVASTHN
jgi:hypothetical protein